MKTVVCYVTKIL